MAHTSQERRLQSTEPSQRLKRLKNAATPLGPEYEYTLAGLLALRARRKGLRFEVYTNVAVARPMDDVVLRVLEPYKRTVFVQLKHATKPGNVKPQAFTQDGDGDFSLKKYFKFFAEFENKHRTREDLMDEDEVLLHDCDLGDVRMVLFTNRAVPRRKGAPDASHLDCPLVELLDTSSQPPSIFSFGEADTEVWKLKDDDPQRDLYQHRFLSQLFVFCKQAGAKAFKKLVKKELDLMFKAPLPRTETFLLGYIEFLKDWAIDVKQDYPLSNSPGELQKLLLKDLEEQARGATGSTLLFRRELCLELREFLDREGALQVTVLGVPPGHRAAKLLQVLNNDFPGCWVYLSDGTLREYPMAALEAACGYHEVRFLVVDVEESGPARNLIAAVASAGRQIKVIVVNSKETATTLLECSQELVQGLVEDWRLNNLTLEAQEKIMDAEVLFQGSTLKLRNIESTWDTLKQELDGNLLSRIANGDKLKLGKVPPRPEDNDVYIPRTLEHLSSLDPCVLRNLDSQKNHLVLSGFPPKLLEEIHATSAEAAGKEKGKQKHNFEDHGVDYPNEEQTSCERWTELHEDVNNPGRNEKIFLDLCEKKKDVNVHWLQYRGDGTMTNLTVTWKRSEGSQAAVAPFVLLASDACTRAPTCVHATETARNAAAWQHQAGLLVGQPGIGKTQFLKRLAAEARMQAPERWVVFVQALAHRHLVQKLPMPKDLRKQHVVDLLVAAATADVEAQASSGTNAVRLCLEAALFRTGAIDVYVDGVDEVCPTSKDTVIRLLELMLDTKVKHVWVSSRPEVEVPLSQILRCQTWSLGPFSKEEQKSFLCKRWSSICNGAPSELETLANEMVEALHNAAGRSNERSLLDVPLHTQMAAEAYAERARTSLSTGNSLLPQSTFSLLELYRAFVERKRDLYETRYGLKDPNFSNIPFDDSFVEIHQNCAMLVLVANDSYKEVDYSSFRHYLEINKNKLPKEKNGILWLGKDGIPQFIHYTFVEFFAASWLFSPQGGSTSAKQTLWRTIQRQTMDSGVKPLLEHMLAEGLSLHKVVLEGNGGTLEAVLATSDPNEKDKFGRLALHVAASLGRADAVLVLLAKGSDLHHKDSVLGWTALRYCSQTHQLEAAERLLQAGADCTDLLVDDIEVAAFKASEEGFLKVMESILRTGVQKRPNITQLLDREGDTLLHKAARKGHCDLMKLQLECGAYVNARDLHGNTPLVNAARSKSVSSVRLLLEHGADIHSVKGYRWSLIVRRAFVCPDLMKLLLENGADANEPLLTGSMMDPLNFFIYSEPAVLRILKQHPKIKFVGHKTWTAVHYAVLSNREEMTKLLLECGGDVNARGEQNVTPLMLAARRRNQSIVRLLLQHKADVNALDKHRMSPIHYAAERGNHEIMKLLFEYGANANVRSLNGKTPIILAPRIGQPLLEYGVHIRTLEDTLINPTYFVSKKAKTPLILAARYGNESDVQLLLKHKADVHAVDEYSWAPIHYAAYYNNQEVIKILLDNDAEIDVRANTGTTPLMLAVRGGNERTVQLLLQQEADVCAVDEHSWAPIHYAAYCGYREVMKILLKYGAEANAQGEKGTTPLMLAVRSSHEKTYRLLHYRDPKYFFEDNELCSPIFYNKGKLTILRIDCESTVRLLLQHEADVHAVNKDSWQSIHHAVNGGRHEIMTLLLDNGADSNAPGNRGTTPLILGVCSGNESTVRLLLQHRANVRAVNDHAWAPIHYAAYYGHHEVMQILLDNSAEINARGEKGTTPLMLAVASGSETTVQLLLEHDADVRATHEDSWAAVHYAAYSGNSGVMKILLEYDAEANARGKDGTTPAEIAMRRGSESIVRLLVQHEASGQDA